MNPIKLLLSSAITMEASGFGVILQGRALDGMLMVVFAMTFCIMLVAKNPRATAHPAGPVTADLEERDLVKDLLMRTFDNQEWQRKRKRIEWLVGARNSASAVQRMKQ